MHPRRFRPQGAFIAKFAAFFVLVHLLVFSAIPTVTPNLFAQDDIFAQGDIIYVNDNANGANNGTSWDDAFTKLQNARAVAGDGDQIWVAAGIYFPDETSIGDTNLATSTFALKAGVAIYGGFVGTETKLSQRNVNVNFTLLSGDLQKDDDRDENNIMETDGNKGTNATHVVSAMDVPASARLDGFTITSGVAFGNGSNCPSSCGGGFYSSGSSATLANITFAGNRATFGAGALLSNTSSSTWEDVRFHNNWSEGNGGGLQAQTGANLTVTHAEFTENETQGLGAGAFFSGTTANLEDVTFSFNRALETEESRGGGLAIYPGTTITLTSVNFNSNEASFAGGAIYAGMGISPVMTNVEFINNVASVGYGGAIFSDEDAKPHITNGYFTGNEAAYGGALSFGEDAEGFLKDVHFNGNYADLDGGAVFINGGIPTFANVILAGNRASRGGAIFDQQGIVHLFNSTLTGNQTESQSHDALYVAESASATLYNTIVWGNRTYDGAVANVTVDPNGSLNVRHSLLEGGIPPNGEDLQGNLNADPLFMRAVNCGSDNLCADRLNDEDGEDYGDLRLSDASPAIDAGNNEYTDDIATDILGNPRIIAIHALPAAVDMGAHERLNTATVGIIVGKIVAGDQGVGNVEVKLTNELVAAGVQLERTTRTDTDGSYDFDTVTPGYYTLVFTLPEGYTLDGASQLSISVVAGKTTTAPNFTLQTVPVRSDGQLFMPAVQK